MGSVSAHPACNVVPTMDAEVTYDSDLGFKGTRKQRTIKATQEEMESAKVALADRDYCVDKLLTYRSCRADMFPFVYKCGHERHDYLTCQYEDYVLRMKEFERERRLREREQRLDRKHHHHHA